MQKMTTVTNQEYSRLLKLATTSSICLAGVLLASKLIIWLMSNSLTILASMTDSMMDLFSSLINYLAVRYASQPPDSDHNYGHAKAESIAGLAQSIFIAASSIFVLGTSINRLINPSVISHEMAGIVVTIFSLFLTIVVVLIQTYVISKTRSDIIMADRLHCQSDIFSNLAILLSLVLSFYGYYYADIVFAIIISIYIFYGVIAIGRKSLNVLLDRKLPDDVVSDIVDIINGTEGILGYHDLRTRRVGNVFFIQVHVTMDGNQLLFDAHDIASRVKHDILSKYAQSDVIIHMDPVQVLPEQ